MQAITREKLEQLAEVFPAERVARSKERWRRLWAGEALLDRYPFVYAPCLLGYYDAGQPPEQRLQAYLDEFLVRGQLDDDFIPAFFPGCRQSTIPNMFGAAEVVMGSDYTCDHLLFDLADIDTLPEPSLAPGTVAHDWLAMEQYVLEETEGRLPIHVTDMQGPADVCGQLWGYDNLLAAAYTDPEVYHALMSRVTDAFILLWQRQQELLGDCFVGTHLFGWNWVPADAGASLSADSLVMISPAFYEEFYQPYLERIATRFGGLAVHSCGDFSAVVPALCATPGVKAVNAGQLTIPELLNAGVDHRTLVIAMNGLDDIEATYALIRQHTLRVDLTIFPGWPLADGVAKPYDAWTAADWDALRLADARVQEAASVTA